MMVWLSLRCSILNHPFCKKLGFISPVVPRFWKYRIPSRNLSPQLLHTWHSRGLGIVLLQMLQGPWPEMTAALQRRSQGMFFVGGDDPRKPVEKPWENPRKNVVLWEKHPENHEKILRKCRKISGKSWENRGKIREDHGKQSPDFRHVCRCRSENHRSWDAICSMFHIVPQRRNSQVTFLPNCWIHWPLEENPSCWSVKGSESESLGRCDPASKPLNTGPAQAMPLQNILGSLCPGNFYRFRLKWFQTPSQGFENHQFPIRSAAIYLGYTFMGIFSTYRLSKSRAQVLKSPMVVPMFHLDCHNLGHCIAMALPYPLLAKP